ncbi:hypothetical protein GUITHDRAFT_143371 [Guillardia theta CCMP2712]|uniref:Myb-like domain-containing protein n=1 Tax=Guillardia theta (strain CCMP2712) TaxID=905079 RepID=L1IUK9_GUITC|nr:hypothetical protein GUITHDRAFT_143371 [Guillardia theta CCMP2712]EKX39589.1 hypothetical protein GUITHDRAFT_143371 [Guillardia theta CCMP2712]|eukprot:XP_005826569.1 hypothetical protein GUITHDRAFT_143371 [Guillardia theta CCMP2712]
MDPPHDPASLPYQWTSQDPVALEDAIDAIFRLPATAHASCRHRPVKLELHPTARPDASSRLLPSSQMAAARQSPKAHASPTARTCWQPVASIAELHAGLPQGSSASSSWSSSSTSPRLLASSSLSFSTPPSLGARGSGGWTEDEHQRFLVALRDYCPDAETRAAQDGRVRKDVGDGDMYDMNNEVIKKDQLEARHYFGPTDQRGPQATVVVSDRAAPVLYRHGMPWCRDPDFRGLTVSRSLRSSQLP